MTREEAIKMLDYLATETTGNLADEQGEYAEFLVRVIDSLDMAIAALKDYDALMAEIKGMCFLCRHYNSGKGNELCECCDDEDNFEWRGAQESLAKKISDKKISDKKTSDWISVEECLPETEMHGTSRVVLAWESEHGRCFAMVYDNGQGKRWFSGGVEIPNITHWMPLPDPPEVDTP